MTRTMLHHIWFDFSETLVFLQEDTIRQFRYATYAEATARQLNDELIAEYDALRKKYSNSNSAVFRSLGLPANFWSKRINSLDPNQYCRLADPSIPAVLEKLRHRTPISIFSNLELSTILPALGIDLSLFTHFISSDMVKEPKPALDGFYLMIKLSKLPPGEILYIGDYVEKDVRPAKQVGIKAGLLWKQSDEADYCFAKFTDILHVADFVSGDSEQTPEHV